MRDTNPWSKTGVVDPGGVMLWSEPDMVKVIGLGAVPTAVDCRTPVTVAVPAAATLVPPVLAPDPPVRSPQLVERSKEGIRKACGGLIEVVDEVEDSV